MAGARTLAQSGGDVEHVERHEPAVRSQNPAVEPRRRDAAVGPRTLMRLAGNRAVAGAVQRLSLQDKAVISRQSAGSSEPTTLDIDQGGDIVTVLIAVQRPGDVASFWAENCRPNPRAWSANLSALETEYVSAFQSGDTPQVLQLRSLPDAGSLTDEELDACRRRFGGDSPEHRAAYANYESRRRIVAHYVYTHPATIALEMGIYRLFRDVNPLHFALERGWQIGSGQEMFTGEDVTRLGAAAEFLITIGLMYGVTRALAAARPPGARVAGPPRPLEEPIWDLPPRGGGMRIGDRWYTEHALERMAPDTPQIRAELAARARARLERVGIRQGHPAYSPALQKAMRRIDPRGVPPSVVESEISSPGSTNVRVITANRRSIVVSVIPAR